MWQPGRLAYNLPKFEEEQAKDIYKEDEKAYRKTFEEEMEIKNIEKKQLIWLEKREENKIRLVLIKLRDEETANEVLIMLKRL